MSIKRSDPDPIVASGFAEEGRAKRGRLKIFFGASAGVGKTYAMLVQARRQIDCGRDVLAGVIETHGDEATQAVLEGIPVLPMQSIEYPGGLLYEFDLDAALALRPELILIDDLAHTNAAASRHSRRWADVNEMLDAGIDVWTTLNVQHIESLNDVVAGITGVQIRETVPDSIFDNADDVVMLDLPADELLERLVEGKVHLPQHAETAARSFFRKGNLLALRELALRRMADGVDCQLLSYRRTESVDAVWQARESLLLCIGPGPGMDKLVRSTARLAIQLGASWHCIYVETPSLQRLSEFRRRRILNELKCAEQAGARTAVIASSTVAKAIIDYAREHNLSRLILGRAVRKWRGPWQHNLASAVFTLAKDLDIVQIAVDERQSDPAIPSGAFAEVKSGLPWKNYASTMAVCVVATAAVAPFQSVLEVTNIVMVFLLAVVFVAMRLGRGPAVFAAFLAVALLDFFYVPPKFSFSVANVQYLVTFGVMLVVGLLIGQLTARLKWQVELSSRREKRVFALYELSRELSSARVAEEVVEIAARFISSEFKAQATMLEIDVQGKVKLPHVRPGAQPLDLGIAQWAHDHGALAGHGTHTLAASPVVYLPLKAPMGGRGVLAIAPASGSRLTGPDQERLLDTCASLIALALERIHYVEVAQASIVEIESERLRSSLLSAVSHDIRTPLSAIVAMTESLSSLLSSSRSDVNALLQSIRGGALRMGAQVSNLLDMARLHAGRVQLGRQWLPVEEAVGSAIRAMSRTLAPERVRVVLPDDLPVINVDPALFERVLCNLLENAAKFTPPQSEIVISASLSGARIAIVFEDEGPGLPPQKEEAIFQMFERGNRDSPIPGVGLGLAICRAIVEAHGGAIRGENRARRGARFLIELPLETQPVWDSMDDEKEIEESL